MDFAGESPARLGVQYLGNGQAESYRVIIYPEHARFREPLVFHSREELERRLSAVLPNFDPGALKPAGDSFPHIVFAESVKLSEAQLADLWRK